MLNKISIDRMPSKTKIGNDSWFFNSSKEFAFFIKTQETATLQQITDGNTVNLVLKRIKDIF